MTTETEQTYLKLVWAKKPCNGCLAAGCPKWSGADVVQHGGLESCGGTGFVLLLPDLSEECPCTSSNSLCDSCFDHKVRTGRVYHDATCGRCRGTGRVPKPMHLETIYEAMREADFTWINTDSVVVFYLPGLRPLGNDWKGCSQETAGIGDLAAASIAAWKAVEARYPQEKEIQK